jgi:hypothetical protein
MDTQQTVPDAPPDLRAVPNPQRDDCGCRLTWHQRRFLNTHGLPDDTLFVESVLEDGEAYIIHARAGRVVSGYIVDAVGDWRVHEPPDTLAVAVEIGLAAAGLSFPAVEGLF